MGNEINNLERRIDKMIVSQAMVITFFKRLKLSALLAGVVFVAIGFTLIYVNHAIAFNDDNGKKLYNEYCASCHGADGRPLAPDMPDFSLREGLIATDTALFEIIADGIGIMPGYKGIISDEDIRDLVTFMRFNF